MSNNITNRVSMLSHKLNSIRTANKVLYENIDLILSPYSKIQKDDQLDIENVINSIKLILNIVDKFYVNLDDELANLKAIPNGNDNV